MIFHSDHNPLVGETEGIVMLIRSLLRELNIGLDDSAINLPLAQFRVCMILGDGPMPMSAIGRELGVSLSAVTQLADRLEKACLVRRVFRESDRRVRCLQLTEQAEKMMRLHHQARIQRMSAVLEQLAPSARGQVKEVLETLVRAAANAREGDGHPPRHSPHFQSTGAVP